MNKKLEVIESQVDPQNKNVVWFLVDPKTLDLSVKWWGRNGWEELIGSGGDPATDYYTKNQLNTVFDSDWSSGNLSNATGSIWNYNGSEVVNNSELTAELAKYLPLTAGSTKPLTDTLYTRSITPTSNGTYSIGNASTRYNNAYVNNIYGTNLNGTPIADFVYYTYQGINNIPILTLKDGTKIAGAPLAGGTSHEIYGINSYTSPKAFDLVETGSLAALYCIKVLYDEDLSLGHPTVDVYDSNGLRMSLEVLVFASDLSPRRIKSTGTTTSFTIPTNAIVQSVNYNRLLLFSDDYTISGGTLTITNTDITGNMTSTDRIEITYNI